MIGINLEAIETLIKKNNIHLSLVKSSTENLIKTTNEISSCYSGRDLEYLFSNPVNEIKNIEAISSLIGNYSEILESVKSMYQQQDSSLANQINHIVSNIK